MWADIRAAILRLTARRYRGILMAAGLTLTISAALLGLIGFTKWRGQQALRSDTHAVIQQVSEQLIRSLNSRRGTLTFVRDTLSRDPTLTLPQLQAMGASAVEHTRHLSGIGLLQAGGGQPVWWSGPVGVNARNRLPINQLIAEHLQRPASWKVRSTFTLMLSAKQPWLVMVEPLQNSPSNRRAIIGLFDVSSLLADFFASGLAQRYPVQLLSEGKLLYRSAAWQPADSEHPLVVVENPLQMDGLRWTLQLQPGTTRVAQTLSWINILVIALSAIAGFGMIFLVWVLTARTWILQRAVNRRTAALRRSHERLRQLAITDELTGLYNRRFFLERWDWEYDRAKRYQRPLACLMIDVDRFKQINDRLGHLVGDLVLKQVAQELKNILRQADIVARFGGDEFVIALPETTHEQASAVAEKLREIQVAVPNGQTQGVASVTLSVGVGHLEEKGQDSRNILEAADQSLYAYRRQARNRVSEHLAP